MGFYDKKEPSKDDDSQPMTEDEVLRMVINYTWGNQLRKIREILKKY